MRERYKVWECKIVVRADEELPEGFDAPPRWGAINAVEEEGINVVSCFSGWGGRLTKTQRTIVDNDVYRDVNHGRCVPNG